jgi:glycosyltransferase involved in cell wall biosynthesis
MKMPHKILIFAKVAKMLNEDFWNVIGKCFEDFVRQGKDFELTIVGGGPPDTVGAVKTIICKYLGSEVLKRTVFRFNVSNEERDKVIEQSDLMIYPLSTEGLGMPIFEAIMRGVPVLRARHGNWFWHAVEACDKVFVEEYGESPTGIYVSEDLEDFELLVSSKDIDPSSRHFHYIAFDEERRVLITTLSNENIAC